MTEVGTIEYRIGAIICHYGCSINGGHYVTYIHHGGKWWLYDDSEVTQIQNVVDEVYACEVSTCCYVPSAKVEGMKELMIGKSTKPPDREVVQTSIVTRPKK